MAFRRYRIFGVHARVWPLFRWLYCQCCRREFRREWGWERSNDQRATFVCARCCPTREDALACFNNEGRYDRRPVAPGGSGTASAKGAV